MMEKYSVSCSKSCLIKPLDLSYPTHLLNDNELESPRQGFFTAWKQGFYTKDCEVSDNSVKKPSN